MSTTVVVGMLLWATAALAEGETAKELFEKGTAAYALGHYDEAAAAYEKAFSLKPDPALLYNAAQAHRQAGNKKRALMLYQNYVRLYPGRVPNRAEVDRIIGSLKQAIESDQRASSAPPTETAAPGRDYGPEPEPRPASAAPPPASEPSPATAVAPTPSARRLTETPPEKPLVKKPWFWAVVAGAVVVVGVGVGLGVGLGTADRNPHPSLGALKVN
jgi:tetratricopeptide (TPR) repeat protein